MLMVDDHIDNILDQGQTSDRCSITKAVDVKMYSLKLSPCRLLKKTNHWWKNKTGSLAKGDLKAVTQKNHSESTNVPQTTPAGKLRMHRTIDNCNIETLLLCLSIAMNMG